MSEDNTPKPTAEQKARRMIKLQAAANFGAGPLRDRVRKQNPPPKQVQK